MRRMEPSVSQERVDSQILSDVMALTGESLSVTANMSLDSQLVVSATRTIQHLRMPI
jgi:hypothetical protein